MKPISMASLKELYDLEESLFKAIAVTHPDEVEELRRVQKLIAAKRDNPTGKEFAHLKRSPAEVITLCLTEKNPSTKLEMFERMKAGGFPFDPVHGWRMFNDNVNRYIKSGKAKQMRSGVGADIPIMLTPENNRHK